MRRLQADMWLVLIALIWGSTFVLVKNSLDTVGPFAFVAARFWVAGGALALVWLARRAPVSRRMLRDGVLTGCLLWAGFVTQTIGLQTTEAGKAAFITGLNVVLVPVFAALLLRHAPPRHVIVGALLATGGLGLMTLDRSLALQQGDLWVMICAGAFALHIIAIARYSPYHAVLPFTLIQLLTTAILASLAALVVEPDALIPPPAALPAILFMGLVATALVFGLQTSVQRFTTPSHAALIFALEPVFAAFFAFVLAGERLEGREWLGGLLVLLAMLYVEAADWFLIRQRGDRGLEAQPVQ